MADDLRLWATTSLPGGVIVGPSEETPGTADWLEWRRGGIGASDAAAIVGMSRWASPYSLWLDKTGQVPLGGTGSEAMRWGQRLEGVVCDAFAEERDAQVMLRGVWVENADNRVMRATLDAVAEVDGELGVLEAKTNNGRDGTWDDGVPLYYQIQVQHQLYVTGLEKAWVAVLLGGQEFRIFDVERDEEAILVIESAAERFWEQAVLKATPPDVDGSAASYEALRLVYPRVGRDAVELPESALGLAKRLAEAKQAAKDAEAEVTACSARLMALLGDAEVGAVNGIPLVTWKETKTHSIDVKRLRAEVPEIAAAFEKESISRVLRLTTRRGEDA